MDAFYRICIPQDSSDFLNLRVTESPVAHGIKILLDSTKIDHRKMQKKILENFNHPHLAT